MALTAIAPCQTAAPMVRWRIVTNAAKASVFADAWRQAACTLCGGTRIGEAFDDAVLALGNHRVVAGQAVVVVARTAIRSATGDPRSATEDAAHDRARDAAAARDERGDAIGVGRAPGDARPTG